MIVRTHTHTEKKRYSRPETSLRYYIMLILLRVFGYFDETRVFFVFFLTIFTVLNVVYQSNKPHHIHVCFPLHPKRFIFLSLVSTYSYFSTWSRNPNIYV